MQALFEDPMVQAGVAPFAVALVVVALLARLRPAGLAGLAVPAALLTTLVLTTGIGFTPLSASKKVLLLALVAPLLGLALDLLPRLPRAAAWGWRWWPAPRPPGSSRPCWRRPKARRCCPLPAWPCLPPRWWLGAAPARRRPGSASATLGLGVAVGVSALLSASIGTLMNGMAAGHGRRGAAGLQFLRGTPLATGWTGALTAGGRGLPRRRHLHAGRAALADPGAAAGGAAGGRPAAGAAAPALRIAWSAAWPALPCAAAHRVGLAGHRRRAA
jgi:hypothetical protein